MSNEPSKFYLTTPIYYVNARPHIGHAYTTIVADVLARRHRLLGDDTFFLTGTDEHGQKIARSAAAAGIPPQQFADQVSKSFENLWKRMGIARDSSDPLFHYDYIRTTDPRHQRGVQKLFSELYARGFIYLASYTGQYCVSDEAFVDVAPGEPCPDCGRPTETLTEENFFFKLSEFQRPLLDLIESNILFITPESRRNEVLSFLRGNVSTTTEPGGPFMAQSHRDMSGVQGATIAHSALGTPYIPGALKDLSISRSSFTWGIPVPEPAASAAQQKHVIYVWLDALANYITALGYGSDDETLFKKFWPADLHLVGKEIIRFHCVYWPAFLLAAGLPLPKQITAHGWLLFDNSKMSKSKGNIVRTETILDAFGDRVYGKQFPESTKAERDLFAADVLRYYLLREIPFGQDGSFSFDALITRYNADLANGYGNLVSRTLTMVQRYSDGTIPQHTINNTCVMQIAVRKLPKGGLVGHPREFGPFVNVLDHDLARLAAAVCFFYERTIAQLLLSRGFDSELKKGLVPERGVPRIQGGEQGCLDYVAMLIAATDEFISAKKPWLLYKKLEESSQEELRNCLYAACESIRIATALLDPFIPSATEKVWHQLGLRDINHSRRDGGLAISIQATDNPELDEFQWGGLKPGTKLGPLTPIFPRADKGLAQIMNDMEEQNAASPRETKLTTELDPTQPITDDPSHPGAPPRTSSMNSLAEPSGPLTVGGSSALGTGPQPTPSHTEVPASGIFANQPAAHPVTAASTAETPSATAQITIADFAKIELRVAQILVAERIPKADKLLRLEVDLGYEKRQILSGIAEFYTPEELIGRRIVVITNLAPRKMRGLESHGMLLAASEEKDGKPGKPILATMAEDIALGSRLK